MKYLFSANRFCKLLGFNIYAESRCPHPNLRRRIAIYRYPGNYIASEWGGFLIHEEYFFDVISPQKFDLLRPVASVRERIYLQRQTELVGKVIF